ncbi:TPA: hypothetical protein PC598_000253 [Morganella morganii]|nr:hypothetical protein [Morganella morganii]
MAIGYLRRTLAGLVLLLLAAGLVLFFTSHLDDFDFDNAIAKELTFTSQENTLSGTLLPGSGHPAAVAVSRRNACRYQSLLKDNQKANVIVFPQAGHGLLQAPAFNYQLSSDWPVLRQWQFLYAGREAYYPGALSLITDWIKNKTPDLTAYYPVCQP